MSNTTVFSNYEDDNEQPRDIRSIREINGEIEDGPCDVLVFNDVGLKLLSFQQKINLISIINFVSLLFSH